MLFRLILSIETRPKNKKKVHMYIWRPLFFSARRISSASTGLREGGNCVRSVVGYIEADDKRHEGGEGHDSGEGAEGLANLWISGQRPILQVQDAKVDQRLPNTIHKM